MANDQDKSREVRSFLMARDPSVDRRFRPRPKNKLRLFDEIQEDEDNGSSDSEEELEEVCLNEDSLNAPTESEPETGPHVYLRLRPVDAPTRTYTIASSGNVLITGPMLDNNNGCTNKNNMEKHYSFNTIFDICVEQREVYETCVEQKIEEDESFTLMTYGTSGSGKTFTLMGDELRVGIIPRALENIFTMYSSNLYPQPSMKLLNNRLIILEDDANLREMQLQSRILALCPDIEIPYNRLRRIVDDEHNFKSMEDKNVSVVIWVSFAEIYNELVYDLLALPSASSQPIIMEPARKSLKIVCNNGEVFIKGLTSIYVNNSSEALKLLHYGQQRVTYASTSINAHSSRSHCIFFVEILKFFRSGETKHTSYKFCDLAGSERLHKTNNVGNRLKEAQRINTSLLVLGRCLDAASGTRKKGNDLIPYRESKLTMLLQASLLGKEKLAMIVTVSPLDKFYEENLNVLNFASVAKNIIFKEPRIKQHNSRYSFVSSYSKQGEVNNTLTSEYVERLESDNIRLRAELERAQFEKSYELQKLEEDLRKQLTDSFQELLQVNLNQAEQRMRLQQKTLKQEYEAKLASQKRMYEEQLEDLHESSEETQTESDSDIEIIE